MMKRVVLFAVLLAACAKQEQPAPQPTASAAPAVDSGHALPPADPARGKEMMTQYACNGCHVIPGIAEGGNLGPALEKWGTKELIVNKFPNNEQNLTQWILNPPGMDRDTTMPAVGCAQEDARDMAVYLLALK